MAEEVTPSVEESEETISLLDIVRVLAKNFWMIFWGTLAAGAIFVGLAAYTLIMPPESGMNPMPNVFTPSVQVMLNEGDSPTSGLSSLMGDLGGLGSLAGLAGVNISGIGGSSNAQMALALLQGKTILDQVSQQFNFVERYGFEDTPLTSAREMIKENMSAEFDDENGMLTITYTDYDPEFARSVLNYTLDLLEARFNELSGERLSTKKEFILSRMEQIEEDLTEAQDALISFQIEYGVFDVNAQAEYQTQQLAELQGRLLEKELEREGLLEFLNQNDPRVSQLAKEISVIKRLLGEIRTGFNEFTQAGIPQNDIPARAAEFLELKRELLIQETMKTMFRQQLETVEIEEADNSKTFQIIERAEIPEEKSGPSRVVMIVAGTMGVAFLLVLIAFIREFFQNIKKDPEESQKWEEIKGYFKRKK